MWVTSEGEILDALQVEYDEDEGQITCFICSEEGKRFEVHMSSSHVGWDVAAHLYLDGKWCDGRVLHGVKSTTLKGVPISMSLERPFVFSRLMLTDDEESVTTFTPDLGTVRVDFHRVRVVGTTILRDFNHRHQFGTDVAHEKTKKLGAHVIGLGPLTAASHSHMRTSTQPFDPFNPGPMMRIIMHYRPREILQKSGLLAPLTQTEEVLRRKRALSGAGTRQEEPIVIKDEDEEDDDEPIQVNADGVEIRKPKSLQDIRKDVDYRDSPGPSKRAKAEPSITYGETIDLTA
jgi:hypothetical protein